METTKLSDNAIAHIAKIVQVAILTGTDIVDNLRMAEFVTANGKLELSPDYCETFDNNIQPMIAEATASQNAETTEEE